MSDWEFELSGDMQWDVSAAREGLKWNLWDLRRDLSNVITDDELEQLDTTLLAAYEFVETVEQGQVPQFHRNFVNRDELQRAKQAIAWGELVDVDEEVPDEDESKIYPSVTLKFDIVAEPER